MKTLPLMMTIALYHSAAVAAGMTLDDVYQLALAKDVKLASSQAQLEANKELPEQAFAQLLPQINASVSDKKEEYQLPRNTMQLNESTNNKNIHITQVLYNRQAVYTLDQAGLKVDYSRLRLDAAINELGVRVSQAYLNVLLTQENLLISAQQVETTEKRLAQVTAALMVGYATKVDKLSLQAELDDVKAKQTTDQQQLIFFRQKLTTLIGQEVFTNLPWPSIDADALVSQFIHNKPWLEEAQNNNFDVQMQQKAVEVARQEIEIRQSAFYPTVNLGGYYSDASGASYFAQKNDNKVVYIEMKMPLYQGGYDTARIRESKLLLRAAEYDTEYAKLASAEEGYRLGVRDITEVSRAKEKLYINRRDQIHTAVELLNALIQLHAVSGQLNAQAVQQISRAVW